jgi:2-amino-4-hydroxy-6-hydroxymethyldihydropteridine diphosphokinase
MSQAFIALGGNLDNPANLIRTVFIELDRLPGCRLLRTSSLYRTAPVGYDFQPDFINAVALLETTYAPHALLAKLLAMETHYGRVRTIRNGPRTLDLDILLYDDLILDDATLTLPHPRMHTRPFVLVPLLEIAPNSVIPLRGRAASMLTALGEHDDIWRIDAEEAEEFDKGFQILCALGQGMVPPISRTETTI